MKYIFHVLAGAAIIGSLGLATTVSADPYADAVEVFLNTGGNGASPGNATGATDAAFAALGDGGSLVLKFTDNTCLAGAGDDVSIADDEDSVDENYAITIGLEGETLSSQGVSTETSPTLVDVSSAFTRIGLTDQNQMIDFGAPEGAEIDSVACLNNLAFGTDHINKTNTGATAITINSKNGADAQQFFSFEITVQNPDGADLSNLTFKDTVPGEFDIISAVADNTLSPTLAGCTSVAFAEHKPGKKLSPDKMTWEVALQAGESCAINVSVATSQKTTNPNKVNWAPTECPAGGVVLNEGVEVVDADGNTILKDDSSLVLSCTPPPADPS